MHFYPMSARSTRYYRMRVCTLTVVAFFSYVIAYKFFALYVINNKNEDVDAANNLSPKEIQELYTKDSSIEEIETRAQKEREAIESLLPGVTKRRLPDVILIGMFKGGTGTMTVWLTNYHPQVVHINMSEYYVTNYVVGPAGHMATIPNISKDTVIYERCTICYTNQDSRERILAMYPERNVKFLVMVRDPIERLISGYVQTIQIFEQQNVTFEEYIFHPNGTVRTGEEYFQKSFYVRHLAKWLMIFPRENIHLVDADIFIEKPWIELQKIEKFFNIGHYFSEDRFLTNPENPNFHCLIDERRRIGMRCMGRTKGRLHPQISEETMRRLRTYFKPYNEQMFTLAGQRFSWCVNYD